MTEPPIVQPAPEPLPLQPAKPKSKSSWRSLLDHRGIMLLVLFGATAALGLPLLWKSPSFSRNEKIAWSIIVSIYTLILFWLFFRIMWWCYTNISQALQM